MIRSIPQLFAMPLRQRMIVGVVVLTVVSILLFTWIHTAVSDTAGYVWGEDELFSDETVPVAQKAAAGGDYTFVILQKTDNTVWVQKIDNTDGARLWGNSGVQFGQANSRIGSVVADDVGGVYVNSWTTTGTNDTARVEHFNASGIQTWQRTVDIDSTGPGSSYREPKNAYLVHMTSGVLHVYYTGGGLFSLQRYSANDGADSWGSPFTVSTACIGVHPSTAGFDGAGNIIFTCATNESPFGAGRFWKVHPSTGAVIQTVLVTNNIAEDAHVWSDIQPISASGGFLFSTSNCSTTFIFDSAMTVKVSASACSVHQQALVSPSGNYVYAFTSSAPGITYTRYDAASGAVLGNGSLDTCAGGTVCSLNPPTNDGILYGRWVRNDGSAMHIVYYREYDGAGHAELNYMKLDNDANIIYGSQNNPITAQTHTIPSTSSGTPPAVLDYADIVPDGEGGAVVSFIIPFDGTNHVWGNRIGNDIPDERPPASAGTPKSSVYNGTLQILGTGAGADGLVLGAGGSVLAGTGQIFVRPNNSIAATYFRGIASKQEQGLYIDSGTWQESTVTLRSDSDTQHTLAAIAENGAATAADFHGAVRIEGDLLKGDLQAVVQTTQGPISFHTIEAPDAYFVDYGSGATQHNKVFIPIDPAFAETVSLEDYRVFVTPVGSDAAVAVTEQTPDGFVVRASQDTDFVYKVVALRTGYDNKRFQQ